tara:strand:+ start:507 stop:1319 length:813 start_codon:yes stop_codon:yes gene_type:complete
MESTSKLWEEFLNDSRDMDLASFKMKDTLNDDIWSDDETVRPEISERLVQIVEDFMKSLDLSHIPLNDITLTGSLANYNWSNYSDLDLHVLIDFNKIDDNFDLVRDFFSLKTSSWNNTHNVKLRGFEVEVYIQDIGERHISTGVYSLLRGDWVDKPTRESPKIDFSDVEKKAKRLIDLIDHVESLYKEENYREANTFASILKEKLKKFRRCGLESSGQYSPENLAFKVLRRNGSIGRLNDLKTKSYDEIMSLPENFNRGWYRFLSGKTVL